MFKENLLLWYKQVTGKDLDLENPQTLNEKIQWLKLYDSTPLKTKLADKLAVRDFVKEKVGDSFLIKLLAVFDKTEDIDFSKLPEKFVLQMTNASGRNLVVTKDSNKEDVVKTLTDWFNKEYSSTELYYHDIPKKIIALEYIEDLGLEYQFFVCNGKVKQVWLFDAKNKQCAMFDKYWKQLKFKCQFDTLQNIPKKPSKLMKMISVAESLASDVCFARVDLLLKDKTIYFDKITFSPLNGKYEFYPDSEGLKLGNKIELPSKKYDFESKQYI